MSATVHHLDGQTLARASPLNGVLAAPRRRRPLLAIVMIAGHHDSPDGRRSRRRSKASTEGDAPGRRC